MAFLLFEFLKYFICWLLFFEFQISRINVKLILRREEEKKLYENCYKIGCMKKKC
jgi:hypothetical protein